MTFGASLGPCKDEGGESAVERARCADLRRRAVQRAKSVEKPKGSGLSKVFMLLIMLL